MTTPCKDSSTPEFHETFSGSTPTESTPTEQPGTPPLRTRRPTPEELIAVERVISNLWDSGNLPFLTHLCGSEDGNYEQWLCDFFEQNVKPEDWVLCSHRAHYHALLHGMSAESLIENVETGKSMFLYMPKFIQSAIVAGTCSIATGLALSIQQRGGKERVWNFVGDGCEDHGHFAEAVRFVHGRKLPCTFIIEDNNSSCGVTKEQRGSPGDWQWPDCVIRYRYKPLFPHAGTGHRPALKWKPSK